MTMGNWTIQALAAATRRGELSPVEVIEDFLGRHGNWDDSLGAFIKIDKNAAISRAQALEKIPAPSRGALHGVPIAIKDNILMAGEEASCGSRMLEKFSAPYTATALERLLRAGAIPLGRTNMDEFAMGSSTENSAFHPVRNPWHQEKVPGGSSGGSAAAVAARMVPGALGSDTGGSIRQPAAFCGITGLKPSYGRISRYGLIAFGSSLDQIGPLTRTAKDAALLLGVMAGKDEKDATSRPEPVPPGLADLHPRIKGIKIGLPREYFGAGIEPEVEEKVMAAVEVLRHAGAKVVEVDLPLTKYAIPTYYLLATAEASSNLSRYDGIHYGHREEESDNLLSLYETTRERGFGLEVKRRILLGTFCLASGYYDAWYKKALQVRTLMRREFARAFQEVDLLIGPTTPHRAFGLGEKLADPLQMYLCDTLSTGANLAGLPALSIPVGFSGGLPVGLQISAPPLAEERALALAAAFQVETDHHEKEPAV